MPTPAPSAPSVDKDTIIFGLILIIVLIVSCVSIVGVLLACYCVGRSSRRPKESQVAPPPLHAEAAVVAAPVGGAQTYEQLPTGPNGEPMQMMVPLRPKAGGVTTL